MDARRDVTLRDPIAAAEGALARELAAYRERAARQDARRADATAEERRTSR